MLIKLYQLLTITTTEYNQEEKPNENINDSTKDSPQSDGWLRWIKLRSVRCASFLSHNFPKRDFHIVHYPYLT